jgi:hypothetical protein
MLEDDGAHLNLAKAITVKDGAALLGLQTRNRGGWSRSSSNYLSAVKLVLESLKDYWPLTLRQVYYQLVVNGTISNNLREYNKLSRVLTKARLDDLVSWDAIEDRARATLRSAGWQDKDQFVKKTYG